MSGMDAYSGYYLSAQQAGASASSHHVISQVTVYS